MGVFKFLKNAGQSYVDMQKRNLKAIVDVFDGDDDQKKKAEAEQKAKAIKQEADNMGLGGDYRVTVEGDTVKLEGKVPDQATLEKVVLTSGNIDGVAQVDATGVETESQDEDEAVFYVIKKGDTLSKIAKVYLGSAKRYPEIFEANRPMLTDPDKIYPGQMIRIPGGKGPDARDEPLV
ncbi:MAG TPA: peptidoglycan-binding protein LysM [Hyphomonas sp.]|nr:peptidoglycan-binding protein LysM [Hyphomonas sp.]MCB9972109.1 peptidoglycan-binding protein LysM [Hyphomonas sp.]HPE47700.1 peptidoglycan-binding protein LysM [Hyphomonas sp.]